MHIQFDSIEIINFFKDNSTARRSSISVDEFELQRSIREQDEDNPFEKIVFNRMSTTNTESSPLHLPERRNSDDLLEFIGIVEEFELQRSIREQEENHPLEKTVFNRMSTTSTESSPLQLPERQKSDDLLEFFGMLDRMPTRAPPLGQHQPLKKRPERRISENSRVHSRLKGQPASSQPLVLPARSARD
jgi:hypothetical protein